MTPQAVTSPEVPVSWVRAALELAVLAALTEGDRHGYALEQRLAGQGLGPVRGGVLYPVLNRMEAEGLVRSTWQAGDAGPGRKVYSMTVDGQERLMAQRASWQRFSVALEQFLAQTIGER